jgi:serine/threonine protein phosphatase PrpC
VGLGLRLSRLPVRRITEGMADPMTSQIELGSTISLDVAGLTDVGLERSRNEDQFLIATLERRLRVESTSLSAAEGFLPGSAEGTVMLVADGMGGTSAGDVASAVAVRSIAGYVCSVLPWAAQGARNTARQAQATLPGVRTGLTSALREGDAEVKKAARARGLRDMGTTLTLAYLQWPQLYVAHAGDSRCYLLRGDALLRLTTDHTLAEKLREQADLEIDAGSPWHHVLWNALGAGTQSAIEPEVCRRELHHRDTILLCSDGLTKHADDAQITTLLKAAPTAAAACRLLVDHALTSGGTDNVTVVVARPRQRMDLPTDSDGPTRVRRPNSGGSDSEGTTRRRKKSTG